MTAKQAKEKALSVQERYRCQFLTGCNRYCIQPIELLNGKPVDSIYFDEAQLEVLGDGILHNDVTGVEPGACSPDPR